MISLSRAAITLKRILIWIQTVYTLIVFLEDFIFENVNFEEKQKQKNAEKTTTQQ